MRLKEIMDPNVETLEYDKSTAEAANLMRESGSQCMVVTHDDEIIGTITGYDLAIGCLVEGYRPWKSLVFRHMAFPAVTVGSDVDMSEGISLMRSKDIDHLPIVDGRRLLGGVSLSGIVSVLDLAPGSVHAPSTA